MRLLLVPLFFCAVLLCARVPPCAADDDVAQWVEDLDAQDVSRRSTALTALRNAQDDRAIPLLADKAPGFSLFGRTYAVYALEAYPAKKVEKAFAKLVKAEDPYLAAAAASWFWRQGDARHVERIVEALRASDVESTLRLYVVNRLHGLDDPRVRAALRDLLVVGVEPVVLGAALQVLQQPEEEASKEAAARLLDAETRPDARAMAAAFLYRLGVEARKAELAAALESPELTTTGFFRVTSFLSQAGHVAGEILDAAERALASQTNAFLLKNLVAFLADYHHTKALPAIQKLVTHDDAGVAQAAFEAIVELGGGIEASDLRALLGHADPERRLSAADLLRRMDDLSGLDAVIGVLRSGEVTARREAAQMLGRFRKRAAVDPLLDALSDADATVRSAALGSLDGLLRALFPYRRLDLVATGYVATATASEREAAVGRLRSWWQAHREGGW